jgi:hypothetical protein
VAYTEEIALAQEMITDFGVLVTVRTIVTGTYNPVTDVDTGAAASTFTAYGVLLPMLNRPELRDLYAINGTGLESNHSILLMSSLTSAGAALPFVPTPGDVVVFGTYVANTPSSNWWKLDSLSTLSPDTTPILYTLLMTKGAGDLLNF